MVLFYLVFLLCTTIRPKIRVVIYFFHLHTSIQQKVHDFHSFNPTLCTTIRPKVRVLIDFFLSFAHDRSTKMYDRLSFTLSLCTTIQPKIRVVINLFFSFIRNHSTKVRGHFYSFIYSFLNCANILFAIFMALLSLYFACSISGSVAFIFRELYSKQYYPYISYIIFMEVLLLYFVHYTHGYMKSRPNSQWSLIMSRNLRQ